MTSHQEQAVSTFMEGYVATYLRAAFPQGSYAIGPALITGLLLGMGITKRDPAVAEAVEHAFRRWMTGPDIVTTVYLRELEEATSALVRAWDMAGVGS